MIKGQSLIFFQFLLGGINFEERLKNDLFNVNATFQTKQLAELIADCTAHLEHRSGEKLFDFILQC